MRVLVDDPLVLPDLLEFLSAEEDTVVTALSADELEVSLLGSYADDAMRMQLDLRLRIWQARTGARFEIAA